jgi:paraquat-inducible protein B
MAPREDVPPRALVKKMGSLRLLIWLIPLGAAAAAGYYVHDKFESSGPLITIKFSDASGIRSGDTVVLHRGVEVGRVVGVELSRSRNRALVSVRLQRDQSAFAADGAAFWLVGPEVSVTGLSGVNTLFSGPYIDSLPGEGEGKTGAEFVALRERPTETPDELHLLLQAPRLHGLLLGAPVSFRGIEVGVVRDIRLSRTSELVEIQAVVWKRYRALVRAHSRFWSVSGFDVKGSLLTGVEVKLDSLRKLVSGEIAFATPEKDMGDAAKDGAPFALEDQPPKDSPRWAPRIPIEPASVKPSEPDSRRPTGKDLMDSKLK